MNPKGSLQFNMAISLSIRNEIQRFESVHPSIYAMYDLIETVLDPLLQHQMREHVVCIEDSFVNSQEWTLSRDVPEIRLGVLGTCNSGKSSLVHRYLTGFYLPEESPEGGRFKKELIVNGESNLLLIRDEGGPPETQFTQWVDAIVFVFSLENEVSFNTIYSYYAKMSHYRNMQNVPIILVGTQDSISETNPRIISDARVRKLIGDLKQCQYYEACATYGLNVDRVFEDACVRVLDKPTGATLPFPAAPGQGQVASKYQSQFSQISTSSVLKDLDLSNNSIPAVTASISSNTNHFPQGQHSPPFRDSTPSGGSNTCPPPPERPERRNKHPPNKDREKNIFQLEEELGDKQVKLMSITSEASRMSSPANSQVMQSFLLQQGHELVDTRDSSSLFSTPSLARKKISSSVQKSSSFSEQSGDSSKDLSTPNTTPTPGRKNRRLSNIFTGKKDEDKKMRNGEPKVGVGRVIPIKQGWLYKRSNKPLSKDWQKKYVTLLDDGRLTYHSSLHDYMENAHGKEIKLIQTTVKIPGQRPRGSEVCPPLGSSKQINGQATKLSADQKLGEDQTVDAVVITNAGLKHEIDSLSLSSSVPVSNVNVVTKMETPNVKKKHRRIKSNSRNIDINVEAEGEGGYEFVIVSLDNKQWHFEASSPEERQEWIVSIEQQILSSLRQHPNTKTNATFLANKAVIQTIRSVKGNANCADCGAANPDWASLNLGALICIECSGIHRNLGTHLSRVRSLELDEWSQELVAVMTSIGNSIANSIWEANILKQPKLTSSSSRDEKEKWIRRKYEQKEFLPALLYKDIPVHQQLMDAVARQDVSSTILVLAYASPDQVISPHSGADTRTALHIAAAVGNVVLVQLLIWYGANIDQLDHEGHTASFYASLSQSPECVKLLQRNSTLTLPRV